jgi:hypothetical protein
MMTDKYARLCAFWQHSNHDRPVVGFTGGYFPRETILLIRQTGRPVEPEDIDVEAFLASCDAESAAWGAHTGDLVWTATTLWGFRWLSAIFGQPLHFGEETIWDDPILKDYDHLDALRLEPDNRWLQALLHLTGSLVEHAAGRYALGATLLTGPLGSLVGLRGTIEFGYDVSDQPEKVEAALAVVTDTWIQVMKQQLSLIPAYQGGYGQPVRSVWAPGQVVEFDEDSSFLLSPTMHARFIVPSHQRVAGQLPYAYLHMHSSQLHTLDNLLDLDVLRAIELTSDVGSSGVDLIPAIRRVQERKPVIVHGYFGVEEMNAIIESVPPEGVCIASRADTPAEAAHLQEQVMGRRGWV